jgi:serine-type D-Ala-D-Ala carboxypeptidase/endopeptidase (penicillin-binding protein 4)
MMRLFGRPAVCVLVGVAVCGVPVWAQTQNVGCDGAVVLKDGRSGPCTELARTIAGLLDGPAVARDHWGIVVTEMDGSPIYSLNAGQLFQPASNAKLFTTAAAIHLLGEDRRFTTVIEGPPGSGSDTTLNGDLILRGAGDANLSGRTVPYVEPSERPKGEQAPVDALRYLREMADAVVAAKVKHVRGDVVGDDTLFPWEPYAQDWTIDDAVWGYGAPVSALSINDNEIKVIVSPAGVAGSPATVAIDPAAPAYYTLNVSVTTGAKKSGSHVQMERPMGSKVLRIYGSIGLDAAPDEEDVAIEDPAEYAATALKQMLEAQGVTIDGKARAEHRLESETTSFRKQAEEPLTEMRKDAVGAASKLLTGKSSCFDACPLRVEHTSATVIEDIVVTNKTSQNLHAELLLHQLGKAYGNDGSTAQGARVVRQFLLNAGIDPDDFVFFDGSGLSGHDLVTPRATARLLQYASAQPWFADWKSSLPVGGEDGSLMERFGKPPLKDHVFAKTGTLGEARALSGYLDCASGRTVIFSIMVGNHLPQTTKDRDVMDRIVTAIAAAN